MYIKYSTLNNEWYGFNLIFFFLKKSLIISSGVGRNCILGGPIQKWVGHLFPEKLTYEKLEEEKKSKYRQTEKRATSLLCNVLHHKRQ